MKKALLILVLLVAAFAVYWFKFKRTDGPSAPKQEALKVSEHSTTFNTGIDSLLHFYLKLKDAFVEGDSAKAKQESASLLSFTKRINIDELKKDTSGIFESAMGQVDLIKSISESMEKSVTITDMRHDFSDISENLYPLLKIVNYKTQTLYWQNCKMPFGENTSANWISNTKEIVNPYLGKNHPQYKSGMLHCGEEKDAIQAK